MLSGVYRFPAMENVVFGKPFAEALAQEADRLDARAVFILARRHARPHAPTLASTGPPLWVTGSPGSAQRSAHTPRDRCGRGGKCGARGRRRSAPHHRRRVSYRRRQTMVGLFVRQMGSPSRHSSSICVRGARETGARSVRMSRHRVCARSRSRQHCRPVSSPRRPAAPTRRVTSRRATAIH